MLTQVMPRLADGFHMSGKLLILRALDGQECFLLGYKTFADGDPLLKPYCQKLLEQRQRRLVMARGTSGEEKLELERQALAQILCSMMRKGDCTL